MAIITFVSDYGTHDHYVAAVKAKILIHNPNLTIVDISHNIEHFNLAHGSFVLNSVFRDFPAGTVHLAAINESESESFIALQLEGHIFVGPDNGLFSLISEQQPSEIVALPKVLSSFPIKETIAEIAARLASGATLREMGTPTGEWRQLLGRKVRATKKQINGHIIRIDGYGNLITNIEKSVFDILNQNNEFVIAFGRERVRRLNKNYHETDLGDCFVLFNSLGFLEIGINHGNARELLGLDFDSPVNVIFSE